jgi:ribonuclease-3
MSRHPLEELLGHAFRDEALLTQALTHRGARAADKPMGTNERLEFLGDRVLGLVIAEALLVAFPAENEGALAARLAALVSAPALARVAESFGLAQFIKVAPGQRADDRTTAVLADACEAVIGALYLDGGLVVAGRFIRERWASMISEDVSPPKDAKTALQEWAQGRGLPLPAYRTITESGPAHAPHFVMEVEIDGFPSARGEGRSKRAATQAAATALIARLQEQQ